MIIHYPSHRAFDFIIRILGRKPQSYYSVYCPRKFLDISEEEFTKLKAEMPGYCVNTIRKAKPKFELYKCFNWVEE